MKQEFTKYENEQNTRSMQLNNKIANLKMESEKIDDEKTTLKNQLQDNASAQFERITDLSKLLMAVDHLEGFCKFKKLEYDREHESITGLNYDAQNMQNDETIRNQFKVVSKNGFDSYTDRTAYATSQIQIIGQYLQDFQKVKEEVENSKKGPGDAQRRQQAMAAQPPSKTTKTKEGGEKTQDAGEAADQE